jgi:hypothetical protein
MLCKIHMIEHSGNCPDCVQNQKDRPYRGMQTPLLKVGGIRTTDVRGKRSWEKLEDLKERE